MPGEVCPPIADPLANPRKSSKSRQLSYLVILTQLDSWAGTAPRSPASQIRSFARDVALVPPLDRDGVLNDRFRRALRRFFFLAAFGFGSAAIGKHPASSNRTLQSFPSRAGWLSRRCFRDGHSDLALTQEMPAREERLRMMLDFSSSGAHSGCTSDCSERPPQLP